MRLGALGQAVAAVIPFETEGFWKVLSSSALWSPLPGADFTQAACGEDKGLSVRSVGSGITQLLHGTPRPCQGQMQRLRMCGQPQPGSRVQNHASQRRGPVAMSNGRLGIPGPQANSRCMVSPWEMGDGRHTR